MQKYSSTSWVPEPSHSLTLCRGIHPSDYHDKRPLCQGHSGCYTRSCPSRKDHIFSRSQFPSHDTTYCIRERDPYLYTREPSKPLTSSVRRKRSRSCTNGRMTSLIASAAVALITAFAAVSAPSYHPVIPLCQAFSAPITTWVVIFPGSSTRTRTLFHPLHSVRKRSGNHDVSNSWNHKITGATTSLPSTVSSSVHHQQLKQHEHQRKQQLVHVHMKQQKSKRSRNVFEQFTTDCAKSPFDMQVMSDDDFIIPVDSNVDSSDQQNHLSQRIQFLLQNDEGEQLELADDSPEAAQQIADIRIYGKLSEEARRKATEAVKEVDGLRGTKDGEDPIQRRRKSTVRATVKETGSDSISTYIKSMGQHELLYREDEVLLGRQVRSLTVLEAKRRELEDKLLRPPTFAVWATATNHTVPSLKQQIRRSQRAKAALIEANLRLVITVARQAVKKSSSTIQFQDACQQGIIGLTRATEKYDPELGFRFSTYAIWWIQKEVSRNVSEQARTVRVPPSAIKKINEIRINERVLMNELGRRPTDQEVADKVGISAKQLIFYKQSAKEVKSLDKKIESRTGKGSAASGGDSDTGQTMESFVQDTDHPSPSELIDQQMMKEDIRRLVKTLSPREQAVIRLRFGLDDGKPRTLGDIGDQFGVDKDRIKKIEASALLKLRQPSRSQVVKCYISEHT